MEINWEERSRIREEIEREMDEQAFGYWMSKDDSEQMLSIINTKIDENNSLDNKKENLAGSYRKFEKDVDYLVERIRGKLQLILSGNEYTDEDYANFYCLIEVVGKEAEKIVEELNDIRITLQKINICGEILKKGFGISKSNTVLRKVAEREEEIKNNYKEKQNKQETKQENN